MPGLPASGLSQRSSSSSGSSGRTAGTGTVPPRPAPTGMPLPGQACPASRSCPDPTETGRGPRAAFWGSLPPAPGKQTLALKEGPKRPPLSSQVSLLQDLGLAPRPMRLGRPASRAPLAAGFPPSCHPGRVPVRLPGTEHPPPHLHLHSLAPRRDPPALPRACTKRAAPRRPGCGCPRQPGSPQELPAGTV